MGTRPLTGTLRDKLASTAQDNADQLKRKKESIRATGTAVGAAVGVCVGIATGGLLLLLVGYSLLVLLPGLV